MLPLVFLCVVSVVGVTALCTECLQLDDIARLAARTASTAEDPAATAQQVARDRGARATSVVDPTGTFLTITVRSERLPLVPGFLTHRVPLAASTTVAIERSPVLD